jgi:hypothetical protein
LIHRNLAPQNRVGTHHRTHLRKSALGGRVFIGTLVLVQVAVNFNSVDHRETMSAFLYQP